ncbi:hypothetical protein Val02_86710 [Virgisporangium aliadipatigenens]|uniref:Uncharacterized protein n=1 Tax=Virgisporangium aliadipatigenens TaxID=741659 RepID=A0A8J3YY07_9ACTN|nr:hypothetical protein [Virgisporangium aliadipatigenens]GIJ51785.1 hypothetical protein Val02_86710 [Virgisporangium aliadipatigenens]
MNADSSLPVDPETFPADFETFLVDFETAEVITPMIYPPQPTLAVTGTKPDLVTEVTLRPLAYVERPEYWGIEVTGTRPGGPHPMQPIANVPYAVQLRVDDVIGTAGIEVIGANGSERIDVAHASEDQAQR